MKLLVATLCLASLPVFAQDSQGLRENYGDLLRQMFQRAQNDRQGGNVGVLNVRFGETNYAAALRGNIMEKDGMLVTLRGEVEIKTDAVIVHADRAVYHKDTGEIEATGNVRITRVAPNK